MTEAKLREENLALANHARWVLANLSGPTQIGAKQCVASQLKYIAKKRQRYAMRMFVASSLVRKPTGREPPRIRGPTVGMAITIADGTVVHTDPKEYLAQLHQGAGEVP